jgi:hypothetical protein
MNVAVAYPVMPISNAGTRLLRQPFAAAMPAAVVGPVGRQQGGQEMQWDPCNRDRHEAALAHAVQPANLTSNVGIGC